MVGRRDEREAKGRGEREGYRSLSHYIAMVDWSLSHAQIR